LKSDIIVPSLYEAGFIPQPSSQPSGLGRDFTWRGYPDMSLRPTKPINHQTNQPPNQSTTKPINHQTNQPANQSTTKPINHQTNQPPNQSTTPHQHQPIPIKKISPPKHKKSKTLTLTLTSTLFLISS
jgi:hypothetical protein